MLLQLVNDTLTTVVSEVVNTAVAVHEVTGGGAFINGVDNSVVGSIVTLLVAAIIRHLEKKKISQNKFGHKEKRRVIQYGFQHLMFPIKKQRKRYH